MIDDLDHTIQRLLEAELPADLLAQIGISFAAPDDEFPPTSVTLPAIDLFLYDVRENTELRSNEWRVERRVDGMTTRPPPVRIDCSYLVTAWPSPSTNAPAQEEHHLLGEVMAALLRHPVIPVELLQGRLERQQPPLPAAALQPGRLQSLAEFWQALGGKPKAALSYTVTIGVEAAPPVELGPPVTDKRLRLRLGVDAAAP